MPRHMPPVWDSSPWFGQSQKSHHVCLYAAREADQARSSQAQGTALPLGKSNSFHDGPAIATRPFSFYLHGEASATLPSSKPLSEELPRLVRHRQGIIPSWACFQEARLEQTLVSVADVLNAWQAASFQMPHFRHLTFQGQGQLASPIIYPALLPTA